MPARSDRVSRAWGWVAVVAGLAVVVWVIWPQDDRLVVYCAHDAEFAEAILREFEQQTGIPVAVRYDTEATKSLGLVNLLKSEARHPRCDVFWNNELLGTVDLREADLLEPYRGAGHERIPAQFKDAEGYWTGFSARLRAIIVDPRRQLVEEEAIERRLAEDADLSRVTIARPLFGTTLTHYTVLWEAWGKERVQAWHRDVRRRGIREAAGNAATRRLVAEGACDFGFTDTDDYFVAKDEGRDVAMLPARVEGKTICIPNTVAIVRGTKRPERAQRLVDFLLSAETELALARSASRQIPLGPLAEPVPPEVEPLVEWARDAIDLRPLLPARKGVIDWLTAESAP